ncbi:hypothetical protein FLK61_38070 [Paenalkalicoccus suaedae]|uniref:Uncharacterized protein n=1 Tax=Paenalkalicoccus suaedae TaxID=2592382 RepID=A0A859FHX5_9BACI|nr:hypothetical protein [Paenalkalicoccus suaedae]QKS72438.1 hypothetical protein FLK61_38070 [Paenalkalicoccus suaedae]
MRLTKGHYVKLEEAAVEIMHRLSDILNINSVYVARNDKQHVTIQHAYNRDVKVIEVGQDFLYEDSY